MKVEIELKNFSNEEIKEVLINNINNIKCFLINDVLNFMLCIIYIS